MLADQYCLTRLINLCERDIIKEIQQSSTKSTVEEMDIDVIGILLTSQVSTREWHL